MSGNPMNADSFYYPSDKPKEVKPAPLDLKSIPTIEGLREERERRLNTAVMNPTEENMKLYLEANHFVQEKSALFADQWRRVAWQNPDTTSQPEILPQTLPRLT